MSGATVSDFIAYWEKEGAEYVRRGDYDWMASLVPGQRVLEIGCGIGFGTAALIKRGLTIFAIDTLPECLEATRQRLAETDVTEASGQLMLQQMDVTALTEPDLKVLHAFAPDVVVCWLMGAPAETTGATRRDAGNAVATYRERIHRAVAELTVRLPEVKALHLVDRTAIPWQAKDLGRDTLVRYHLGKTLLDLPFKAVRADALYRKLGENMADLAANLAEIRRSNPMLKSVTPTLASLLAHRKQEN
jgi:SAM-dependent methyltransferase